MLDLEDVEVHFPAYYVEEHGASYMVTADITKIKNTQGGEGKHTHTHEKIKTH